MRLGSLMFAIILLPLVGGCQQDQQAKPEIVTLYRNSPLDQSRREHFASFDTSNHNDYNRGNCGMTARLLNANISASAKVR